MVAHPLLLQSLGGFSRRPLLVERHEEDFATALLGELARDDGISQVRNRAPSRRDQAARAVLLQPLHRAFNVVVLEVACDVIGTPRVDPQAIVEAGLVVRRCGQGPGGAPRLDRLEAWRKSGDRVVGWMPMADTSTEDDDPNPLRRRRRVQSGQPIIERLLLRRFGEPLSEPSAPLFVAPPDVCTRLRRTVLWGVLSVTPGEAAEPTAEAPFDDAFLRDHLSPYLLRSGVTLSVPRAGNTVVAANADDSGMEPFVNMLRQLTFEFDAFGDSAEAIELRTALNTVSLPLDGNRSSPAGSLLGNLANVLARETAGTSAEMPERWPTLTSAQEAAILAAIRRSLLARLGRVRPETRRYEEANRYYVARAFARVQHEASCPPAIVWSDYSEPFSIAPWYEAGLGAPARIPLPNVNDAFLRRLKPNVAFGVPRDTFNLLSASPLKGLLDGKKGSGGFDVDWICSFSLPIITLCAFIVLNLFLGLLDLVFRWLLFIKICIPIPRRTP